MWALGWELVVSSDLARTCTDASTLVFRSAPPLKSRQPHVVALSTHETDKLRIVNADASEGLSLSLFLSLCPPPPPPPPPRPAPPLCSFLMSE